MHLSFHGIKLLVIKLSILWRCDATDLKLQWKAVLSLCQMWMEWGWGVAWGGEDIILYLTPPWEVHYS